MPKSVAMTTSAKAANCLERVSGNDPESRLWQSRVRPFSLYPQIFWWMLQDSNLWPTACRAVDLPADLNILGAFDWTRTSTLLDSYSDLNAACLPIPPQRLF